MSFFDELKRRNVIRVGIAYTALGWVLAQAADFAFDILGAPEWALRTFVVALLLGLPVILIFAWAFELTPDGIRREKDVDRSDSITRQTSRKLDRTIVVLLVIAVAAIALDRLLPENGQQPAEPVVAAADQSIAVLPFADLSPDQADAYLGQGLAEELLNALAQFPALRVAARTSAFAVADDDLDLREVGEVLGVAHVLEGSVRRSGDRVRITAQLIRANDGFHLWSETYERAMTDIFAIQDEIVRELSLALQVRLGVGAGAHRASSRNFDPRAYDSYLRGLQLWSNRQSDSNRQDAIRSFRLATEIDPALADAWAAYALSLLHSNRTSDFTGLPRENWMATVLNALETALELEPNLARAHAGLTLYFGRESIDVERSIFHSDQALELAPNSAAVRYSRASAALVRGDYELARREMAHARQLDPLNIVIQRIEAAQNMLVGQLTDAHDFVDKCLQTSCEGYYSRFNEIDYAMFTGDLETAERLIGQYEQEFIEGTDPAYRSSIAKHTIGTAIASFRCEDTFVQSMRDRDYWARIPPSNLMMVNYCLIDRQEYTLAADYMFDTSQYHGVFTIPSTLFNLVEGPLEFPDEFRKHARYHEFWARPGYRELAAARIANGHPGGLPLHEDGTPVDFSATP